MIFSVDVRSIVINYARSRADNNNKIVIITFLELIFHFRLSELGFNVNENTMSTYECQK